jgi:hypothetical protein
MLETAQDRSAAKRRLAKLQRTYPLPPGCALQDTFLQRIVIGKLELFMVGLLANTPTQPSVTGSAADSQGYPVDRAFFELLERMSIMLARDTAAGSLRVRDPRGAAKGSRASDRVFPSDAKPDSLRTALSNGVALHESWPKACAAALCELVERDRVLRSFQGEFAPKRLENVDRKLLRALGPQYAIEAYEFGPARDTKLQHTAAGLFLFPRNATHPLAYGFAAALAPQAALAAASGEALQRLAFLWGEDIPSAAPAPTPTPDYHQEHYLYPPHQKLLRAWLAGKRPKRRASGGPAFDGEHTSFVDLTPTILQPLAAVAKAISRSAKRLRFGSPSPGPRTPPHPIA